MNRKRQLLLDRYGPDELVDILHISSEDILNRFEDKVEEHGEDEEEDCFQEE